MSEHPRHKAPRAVLGLSGKSAAGKTTAAGRLASHGWTPVSYSRTLTALGRRAADEVVTRDELRLYGSKVNKEHGQRWLSARVLETAGTSPLIVVDGIRYLQDRQFFEDRYGHAFIQVHLIAPLAVRMQRYIARGGSREEFLRVDFDRASASIDALASLAEFEVRTDTAPDNWLRKMVDLADSHLMHIKA